MSTSISDFQPLFVMGQSGKGTIPEDHQWITGFKGISIGNHGFTSHMWGVPENVEFKKVWYIWAIGVSQKKAFTPFKWLFLL